MKFADIYTGIIYAYVNVEDKCIVTRPNTSGLIILP